MKSSAAGEKPNLATRQNQAAAPPRAQARQLAPVQTTIRTGLLQAGGRNPFGEVSGGLVQPSSFFGAAQTTPRKDSISPPRTLDILAQLKLDGGVAIEQQIKDTMVAGINVSDLIKIHDDKMGRLEETQVLFQAPTLSSLSSAFAMERYDEKHDIKIVGTRKDSLTPEALARVKEGLEWGSVGLAIGIGGTGHAETVLINEKDGQLKAIWLDSVHNEPKYDSEPKLRSILSQIDGGKGAEISIVRPSASARQTDFTSCHTDAMVILKEALLFEKEGPKETGDFFGNFKDQDPLPAPLLRTGQRQSFLSENNADTSQSYRLNAGAPDPGKTLQGHIDAHTTKHTQMVVDSQRFSPILDQNLFLPAKTYSFALAALDWLQQIESQHGNDAAVNAAEALQKRHFTPAT